MSPLPEHAPDAFVTWIEERYAIYLKKEAGEPKPWSNIPVMQKVYFCNVHRENDKVTRWIRSNFPLDHPYAEFNMMLARMVNKPSSLEAMGWPFKSWFEKDQERFMEVMKGQGTWGGAYIVSTNGSIMSKHTYVARLLSLAYTPVKAMGHTYTLEAAHKALMGLRGLGSFMAAQIVADLKHTPNHPLTNATDWWTWCAYGPGSLRGMAWVTGEEKCTRSEFDHCIPWLREYVDESLAGGDIPKFCNQDLQNCLCEFDKFMRVTNKTGRSKRKYNGTHS